MSAAQVICRTARLALRRPEDRDRGPLAAMSADPEVMRFFPSTLSAAESDALLERLREHWRDHGLGFWVVEDDDGFAGLCGLLRVTLDVPFARGRAAPPVEVGWRLARRAWGRGYATEAGREALRVAFEDLGEDEVFSFTTVDNLPSRRVMERLGMRHDVDGEFDHPRLPEGHPLRRHVLYRLARPT